MIIPLLFSGSLFVTPAKDTVWWNTTGGEVTEHRDQTGATCSLMFYDNSGSVVFEWSDPGRTLVTAVDWNWQFPEDWKLPVAMQVGDVWLSNNGDSAIIPAVGHGNTVSFSVNQPVENLLASASHIETKTTGGQLSINLRQTKVGVLLAHAQQCRDVIRR